MIELLSLLGAGGAGKICGIVGDLVSARHHRKIEEKEQSHREALACRNSLKEYYDGLDKLEEDGTHSPLTRVIAFCIGLFGVTYCIAALTCFFDNPAASILTKDPSSEADTYSLLFGFIEWSVKDNRVVSMSKIGLGYLMLHPIIFVLSMAITGDKIKKG